MTYRNPHGRLENSAHPCLDRTHGLLRSPRASLFALLLIDTLDALWRWCLLLISCLALVMPDDAVAKSVSLAGAC